MSTRHTAAAIVALALAPAGAAAATADGATRTGRGAALSPRLAALAQPRVRALAPRERAARLGLPARGAGSLVHTGGRVVVNVRVTRVTPAALRALAAAGADVLHVAEEYRTVAARVRPQDLERLAAAEGVEYVEPELRPATAQAGGGGAPGCTGAATSEADDQLRAAEARNVHDVTGAGVTVGIISDSFDTDSGSIDAADDVASGDLPGAGNKCGLTAPVQVLAELQGGSDEGRAMAQAVHDLAPGARLAFATGFPASAFGDRMRALRDAGAQVIADDLAYLDEPFFQDGPQAVAVNDAAAAGVAHFSSAANHNLILSGQGDSSTYEAPGYRPATCPTMSPAPPQGDCMDFDPDPGQVAGRAPFAIAPGGELALVLQWAEPWFGVTTDLDVHVLDAAGNVLASGIEDNPGDSQKPFELVAVRNTGSTSRGVFVVVSRFAGTAAPRLKWMLLKPEGQILSAPPAEPPDAAGPAIYGHNGATGAMSVAAVPFNDSATIEPFSSRGPVTHYFGPVNGTTRAAPLPAPQVIEKPDVAATDGAANTFFGAPAGGVFRFFGTSQSAPHAAAVAALQMSAAPGIGAGTVLAAQRATATPVGAFGRLAAGAGLLNATAAVAAVKPATPPPPPPPAPTAQTVRPRDVTRPFARALTSRGRRGSKVRLRFRASDDRGPTRVTIAIFRGQRRIRVLVRRIGTSRSRLVRQATWRAPRRRGRYRFCVTARDAARNSSRRSCARIVLRSRRG